MAKNSEDNFGKGSRNKSLADLLIFTQEDVQERTDFDHSTRSEYHCLILILQGSITGKISLKELELHKNHFFIVAPNAVTQSMKKTADCSFIGLAFKTAFLEYVGLSLHQREVFELMTMRLPHTFLTLNDKQTEEVSKLMWQLGEKNKQKEDGTYTQEILKNYFLILMLEIAEISKSQHELLKITLSRKEDIVIKFGSLVTKHFKEQKQLQFYADQIFISPKYLTKTVKEITGKTAGDILDQVVIRECMILLEDPSLSISEIASILNFSDQSFFGKYFKRHTGISPKAYRSQSEFSCFKTLN